MNKDSVEVTVKGVMPTSNGCATFWKMMKRPSLFMWIQQSEML